MYFKRIVHFFLLVPITNHRQSLDYALVSDWLSVKCMKCAFLIKDNYKKKHCYEFNFCLVIIKNIVSWLLVGYFSFFFILLYFLNLFLQLQKNAKKREQTPGRSFFPMKESFIWKYKIKLLFI